MIALSLALVTNSGALVASDTGITLTFAARPPLFQAATDAASHRAPLACGCPRGIAISDAPIILWTHVIDGTFHGTLVFASKQKSIFHFVKFSR